MSLYVPLITVFPPQNPKIVPQSLLIMTKNFLRYFFNCCMAWANLTSTTGLTLFDMGGHDAPPNVFDHCFQTLRRRKLKLVDF